MFARWLGLWFLLLLCNADYAQTWKYDLQIDSLTREQRDLGNFGFRSHGKQGFFSVHNGLLLAAEYDEIRANPAEMEYWPDAHYLGLHWLAVRKGNKWAVFRVKSAPNGKNGAFVSPPGSKQFFVFDSITFSEYGKAVGHWKKAQVSFSVYDDNEEVFDREEMAERYADAVPAFDEAGLPGTYLIRKALRRIHAEYQIKEAAGKSAYIFTYRNRHGVFDVLKNQVIIEPSYANIHYKGDYYYCVDMGWSNKESITVLKTSGEIAIPQILGSDYFYWEALNQYGVIAGLLDSKFVILDSALNVIYSTTKRVICTQQNAVPSVYRLQRKDGVTYFNLVSSKFMHSKMDDLLFETHMHETVFYKGKRYYIYDPLRNKSFVLPFEKMYQRNQLILGISKGKVGPLKWVSAVKQAELDLYDSIVLLPMGFVKAPGMIRVLMTETQFAPKYFQTYRKGSSGLIDANGNLILAPHCDSIVWNAELTANRSRYGSCFLILKEGYWSICFPDPNTIQAAGFTEIRTWAGYYFLDYIVNGPKGWNIYNLNDGYRLSNEAEAIEPIYQSCYSVKYADGYHVFPRGDALLTAAYDSIWNLNNRFLMTQKNGYFGLLRTNGYEIIAPECDSLDMESGFSTGIIYTYLHGKAGFYYKRSREKEVWDQVLMGQNRIAWTKRNGKWGIVSQ